MPNNSTQSIEVNIKLFIVINKMNTPSGSSLGIPMKPHMKIIDDLHYKYLFFLSSLDSDNLVKMEEEEKRLFAYMVTYKQYLFSLDTPTEELRDFGKYTVRLTKSVVDNYLNIFQDKDLDLKEFLNDKIINSFETLKRSLLDIVNSNQSLQSLHYITCVLVCTSLLFLIRTTKRSLFMYLSQKNSNPRANANNASNIKAVVGIEPMDINIKDKLANVILYVADYIASVQSLVVQEIEKYARMLAQAQQAINNTEQSRKTLLNLQDELRKTKDNCASEVDDLKKQLAEQMENMQRLQNEEGKKQMFDKLERQTAELKNNMTGIFKLAENFDRLFKRWDDNVKDKDIVILKMNALNEYNTASHEDNQMYQDALRLLSSKLDVSQVVFAGNLRNDSDNIIIQLAQALLQLNKEKVIMKPEGLEVFYGGSQVYNKLVLLYEELSGAVRAVVRVRDVYASMTGGNRKRKLQSSSASHTTSNKRRKLHQQMCGGADDTRFANYEIKLDKQNKLVAFAGIDANDKVFKTKTLQHGPFFSVHNNDLNDPNAKSIEDDLLQGIGFDTLVNMFNGTPEKNKEPAIVMYTYGYSGSGKSYTLFGEKTLNNSGLPKAGVMWEIVRKLQSTYDLKLVNSTICYGYLDYADNGYVFKTNDLRPSNKNSTNVNQWANIINKDFADALNTVNDDSFIKVTPNNPESSRGFYIVKVALYEKNTNYRNVKGYIGVVDMAGNEDPFDIAATICPTMKFSEMNTLLSNPNNIHEYDIVYEKMQGTFLDVLTPTIMTALAMKYKGTTSFNEVGGRTNPFKSATLNALEGNEFRRLCVLRDQLSSVVKLKGAQQGDKTQPAYVSKTTEGLKDLVTYHDRKAKIQDVFLVLPPSGSSVVFHIHAGLLLEICQIIKNDNEQYIPNAYKGKSITINDIRQAILQGETEIVNVLKIQYAMGALYTLLTAKMGSTKLEERIIATLSIETRGLANLIANMQYYDVAQVINDKIKQAVISLSNTPYLLPFTSNGKLVEYRYSTIARIIKEGYYINKANAELMDYFKKKLLMQDVNKIVTVNKGYDFDASFAFTSYNKFARDFVPIVKSNTNSSQKDFEYDTGLVDIIKEQFPGKNKDIVFACVRNDKDFGKILGAIDTLELIKDLKST
jgi:hypothetical protein